MPYGPRKGTHSSNMQSLRPRASFPPRNTSEHEDTPQQLQSAASFPPRNTGEHQDTPQPPRPASPFPPRNTGEHEYTLQPSRPTTPSGENGPTLQQFGGRAEASQQQPKASSSDLTTLVWAIEKLTGQFGNFGRRLDEIQQPLAPVRPTAASTKRSPFKPNRQLREKETDEARRLKVRPYVLQLLTLTHLQRLIREDMQKRMKISQDQEISAVYHNLWCDSTVANDYAQGVGEDEPSLDPLLIYWDATYHEWNQSLAQAYASEFIKENPQYKGDRVAIVDCFLLRIDALRRILHKTNPMDSEGDETLEQRLKLEKEREGHLKRVNSRKKQAWHSSPKLLNAPDHEF